MENTLKSKSVLKTKERKPYCQNETATGKINKTQNEVPQQFHFDNFHNSPIKKALNEMNAIVKIGVEKDFSLYEKNSVILNSSETIDNLRKNVLHLQMEYEKLDQNFQKEISQRSEITQRMDANKNLVESVLNSATLLGNSIKQLENDKVKLAEFYELVYQTQIQADKKYETVQKLLKEQDSLIKIKLDEISKAQEQTVSKNAAALTEINDVLMQNKEKLKTTLSENEKLSLRVEGLTCVTKHLHSSLKSKQKVIRIQQENSCKLQSKIKHLKIVKNKYAHSHKNMKKKILILKQKNNQLANHLSETEYSYRNSLVNMENIKIENAEFKSKFEKVLKSMETEKQKLEGQNNELLNKITALELEKKELHDSSTRITEKINEIEAIYEIEKKRRNEMEEKYNEIAKRNEQLQLKYEELNKENDKKKFIITDLKEKVVNWENNFNSEMEFYKNELKNFQNIVNEYKKKIVDLEEKLSIADSSRQNILKDCNAKLIDNQKLTEKIENLTKELMQNTDKIELLKTENSSTLTAKNNLENHIKVLQEELKLEKKLQEECKAIKKNLEKELYEMKKVMEENLKLKDFIKNLKNRLEESEAKIEAYRVIVKKLESEKIDGEENHSLEISRQKLEITRLEESENANERLTIVEEALRNCKNNQSNEKEKESTTTRKNRSKKLEFEYFKTDDPQFSSTPSKKVGTSPQSAVKKVATSMPKTPCNKLNSLTPQSTPRKIFTSKSRSQSTPVKKFPDANSLSTAETPKNKITDPYNFDSDDSNEILDPKQVLRLFGPRQKKEHDRKSKSKK